MLVAEVDPRSSTHRPWADSQVRDSSLKPLERRVSFCAPCPGMVSAPDEPRKSFMKFCETDDILDSTSRPFQATVHFVSERCISTLPFKNAPSSMEMRWAVMSPVTMADLR